MKLQKTACQFFCTIILSSCLFTSCSYYSPTPTDVTLKNSLIENEDVLNELLANSFSAQLADLSQGISPDDLSLNNIDFGMFTGSPQDLLDSLQSPLGTALEFDTANLPTTLELLSELSGIPLLLEDVTTDYPVNLYNPDLVTWLESLIPSNTSTIQGFTLDKIYDSVFSDFFRLLAASYDYLDTGNRFEVELEKLKTAMLNTDFNPTVYIETNFSDILPEYNIPGSTFNPEDAILFWLQNGIRGIVDVVWSFIERILVIFDLEWYKQLLSD